MIASVETITPDTENFNDIYVSFALDACSSVYSSLSFIIDHNDEHIIDVVTYARDTVDMFIQEKEDLSPSDSALEEKIKSDIAMVRFEQWLNDVTIKLESSRSEKFTNEILLSLREDKAIIELDLLA